MRKITLVSTYLDTFQPHWTNPNKNHQHAPKTPHSHRIIRYPTKIRAENQHRRHKCCTIHQHNLLIICSGSRPNYYPIHQQISTFQYALTQDTMEKCNQYLDYASTHTNTTIKYYASDMILTNDTYGTHIIILEARSRIEGHYYFAKQMLDYYKGNPTPNGPILK